MPLITKTYNEIFSDSITSLESNTSITGVANQNSVAGAFLRIISKHFEDRYLGLIYELGAKSISQASGDDLDAFGLLLNTPRIQGKTSEDTTTSNFKFYINPTVGTTVQDLINLIPSNVTAVSFNRSSGTLTILPGITVYSTDKYYGFTTTAAITLSGSSTEGYVGVRALGEGSSYNVPDSYMLNNHNLAEQQPDLASVTNYILCTNLHPIYSGISIENDADYRYRLINSITANEGSNVTAIRLASLSVPGVKDVVIKPMAYGVGTYKIIVYPLDSGMNMGLANAVKEITQKLSAAHSAYVDGPAYKSLRLKITPMFNTTISDERKDALKSQIYDDVINYIINIPKDGTLILTNIIAQIMNISKDIIDVKLSDMYIGDYNWKYAEIENEYPALPQNIKLGTDELFYTNKRLVSVC